MLDFSRYDRPNFAKTEEQFRTQAFGGHADEIETSKVLYLRGDLVDMKKAIDDSLAKNKPGILTPVFLEGGILNYSGINGYATLGTEEKGSLSMNAYTREVVKHIDSITICALPQIKNRSAEYQKYEGVYLDTIGRKLTITQKDNRLYFVWNGRDLKNFVYLSKDAEDFFSSMLLDILFVKNESGEVVNAWCKSRGENFWVTKLK